MANNQLGIGNIGTGNISTLATFTSGSFPLIGAEDTSGTNRFFKLVIE